MTNYTPGATDGGVLHVVATPIGNLGDIGQRAVETLRTADRILAEDTRHVRRLLTHYGIERPVVSLHEHNERARVDRVLEWLAAGARLALVSDAGTPLISDPGFVLVRSVRAAGYPVLAVPGPSAVIAALSVAGLPTDRFHFEGFLPSRPGARRARLDRLASLPWTLVIYESCHRIEAALADLAAVLGGQRSAALCRELTKRHEQVVNGTLEFLCEWLAGDADRRRGEFVLVIEGARSETDDGGALDAEALETLRVLLAELPPRQAARLTAARHGVRSKAAYRAALAMTRD